MPIETVVRAIERAKAAGMTVVLNPAPAALLLGSEDSCRSVDVLTPNESEAESSGRGSAGRAPGELADGLLGIGARRSS